MSEIRCLHCYSNEFKEKNGKLYCQFCGSKYTKRPEDQEILLSVAFKELRFMNFIDAETAFDDIIDRHPKLPEAYWGGVCARYGIKFEQDYTGKQVPTCCFPTIESILLDDYYLKAVSLADRETAEWYRQQGEYLERVRQTWNERARKLLPYDIFISYKDSVRENGSERTKDSIKAQSLYTHLLQQGYSVFYSRESLSNVIGEKYEPYIFHALNTAKVMIVYASKPEYITSTWVRNEWQRYSQKIQKGEKKQGSLVVICDGFSPAKLPSVLRSMQVLDGQDMFCYTKLDAHLSEINVHGQADRFNRTASVDRNQPKVKYCISCKKECAESTQYCPVCRGQKFGASLEEAELMQKLDWMERSQKTTRVKSGIDFGDFLYKIKYMSRGTIALIITCLSLVGVTAGVFGITTAVQNHKIDAVEALIADLPTNPEYYIDYHQEIVDAYAAYQELDPKLQDKVENADKLFSCMESLEVEEAYEMQQNLQFIEANGGYAVSVKEDCVFNLSGIVEIPATYRGQPVTTIPESAFAGCSRITSITVPDSVTSIGYAAFSGCIKLQAITLPFVGSSRTATGESGLFGYIFGEQEQSGATKIRQYTEPNHYSSNTFDNYIPSLLTKVTITDAIQISYGAFYNCSFVKEINLCDSIASIDEEAFVNCSSITAIYLPNITTIPAYAFKGCSALAVFNIGESVTSIGSRAFFGCSQLLRINSTNDGEFIIGKNILSIEEGAFSGCIKIKSITLPYVGASKTATGHAGLFGYIFGESEQTGATKTRQYTEDNHYSSNTYDNYIPSNLKKVIITDATQISYGAFYNCSFLTDIVLCNSIISVDAEAFTNCSSITTINLPNISSLSPYIFKGCSSLLTFEIGELVTSIGTQAFYGCIQLESINSNNSGEFLIQNNILSIGEGAFGGCIKMTSVTLPFVGGSKTSTGKAGLFGYVFGGSEQTGATKTRQYTESNHYSSNTYDNYIPSLLNKVTITNASQISYGAFYNCSNIITLRINSSVKNNVAGEAFVNCIEPTYY